MRSAYGSGQNGPRPAVSRETSLSVPHAATLTSRIGPLSRTQKCSSPGPTAQRAFMAVPEALRHWTRRAEAGYEAGQARHPSGRGYCCAVGASTHKSARPVSRETRTELPTPTSARFHGLAAGGGQAAVLLLLDRPRGEGVLRPEGLPFTTTHRSSRSDVHIATHQCLDRFTPPTGIPLGPCQARLRR
jgi:hypothetical protein